MSEKVGFLIKEVSDSTTTYAAILVVPDGTLSKSGSVATVDMSGGSGHGVGSVTQHSDVSDAGSGAIITVAERTKVAYLTVTSATDLDAIRALLLNFNGANELVQLDGSGALPVVSGAALTGVVKPSDAGTVFLAPTGDASGLTNVPEDTSKANAGTNSDIIELQGLTTPLSVAQGGTGSNATANSADGVVVLDSISQLPAVSGLLLTNVLHPWVIDNHLTNHTILASEFDKNIITTVGITSNIIFTLPPAADVIGKSIKIVKNEANYDVQIKCGAADRIEDSVLGGTFTSDSLEAPHHVIVTSIGNNQYLVQAQGVWLVDLNEFS